MSKNHSFHIPVMGIGFTVDTPIKVSQYGIDSVISLVDDILLEKLRKMYCEQFKMPYDAISDKTDDSRAKRITSYLNLMNTLAEKKFKEFKNSTIEKSNDLKDYFNMLPDNSSLKEEFKKLTTNKLNLTEAKNWLKENLSMGSIDVNIMTKVDNDNFKNGEKLPSEYNDAHAALRGYANSDLESSVILSAGMNPRLYSYLDQFEDFFPNENGFIKKKIVLKVSDYRSALIQGKFLAKKGIWVSEYRIESGLNCGGHAFASDGFLLGPILDEFRLNRKALWSSVHDVLLTALETKGKTIPHVKLELKITAQGGVGNHDEHQFLIDHYNIDSVGWGTPFLLTPEVTTVDDKTLTQLSNAAEDDLYLSNISPLGVPFNSLRGNSKDAEKIKKAESGRPGSSCPREFLASNKEYTENNICTASRQYQRIKVKELDKQNLSKEEHNKQYDKIVEKSCICVGLGTSALLVHDLENKVEKEGVSICPGPNLAYFSKITSLKEMADHIYGRASVISRTDRPNFFIKEIHLYLDYLKNSIAETTMDSFNRKQKKYLMTFANNMNEGLNYYQKLFTNFKDKFQETKDNLATELDHCRIILKSLHHEIDSFVAAKAV